MAKMDVAAYLGRADEYVRKGNYELALSNMKVAVAMDPHNVGHREKLERLSAFIGRQSTIVAYLLFVFLGLFGIHQFYIRNVISGAWRLILMGVFFSFPFQGILAYVLSTICAGAVIAFWGKDLITLRKQVRYADTRIYFIPVIRFLFNGIYNIPVMGSICSFVRNAIEIILGWINDILWAINIKPLIKRGFIVKGVFIGAIIGTIVGGVGGIIIIIIGHNIGGVGGAIVSAVGIFSAVVFGINGGIVGGTSDEYFRDICRIMEKGT